MRDSVDLLVCERCERAFTTVDGPGMLEALKGPCPDCGGRYQLRGTLPLDREVQYDGARDPVNAD